MKKIILFFAYAAIIFFSSCKDYPTPKASFNVIGNGGTAPCSILFENTSVKNTRNEWDFGDGTTSLEKNPSHIYTKGGTYDIKLTVRGDGGNDVVTKQILIQDEAIIPILPTCDFTFTPNGGERPCTIVFTNLSTNATSYLWDFGDGSSSTEENPTHEYTISGNILIALTSINSDGEKTKTKSIVIAEPLTPIANFTFTPATGQAPCIVTFTNTSTNYTSVHWNFGDGQTSTVENPIHNYINPGNYQITLTAINSTIQSTKEKIIIISKKPTPNFTYSFENDNQNAPTNVIFTNTTQEYGLNTSYMWDFGDGNYSSEKDPNHQFLNPGVYQIKLTATNDYGSLFIVNSITIL